MKYKIALKKTDEGYSVSVPGFISPRVRNCSKGQWSVRSKSQPNAVRALEKAGSGWSEKASTLS